MNMYSIVPEACYLSHDEAMAVYQLAVKLPQRRYVVIDLRLAEEATTSAFARLVLLRKMLLERGCDLCLVNLHDRVANLYAINRLDSVLPLMSSINN